MARHAGARGAFSGRRRSVKAFGFPALRFAAKKAAEALGRPVGSYISLPRFRR